ncbi:hypothetical protein D6833_08750 [Candidatus Parcubacteria bacterium]|nr:MAG: hypothetical protein D6833_08750 [Candidatus Parcubacteria bacterium]
MDNVFFRRFSTAPDIGALQVRPPYLGFSPLTSPAVQNPAPAVHSYPLPRCGKPRGTERGTIPHIWGRLKRFSPVLGDIPQNPGVFPHLPSPYEDYEISIHPHVDKKNSPTIFTKQFVTIVTLSTGL